MSTPHAPPPSQAGAAAAAGVHALPASKRSRLEEAGFAAVVRMELKKKQGEMVSPFSSHSTALSLLSPLFFLHSPALFSPRFFCVIEHCSCSSRREKRERAKAVDAIEEFRLLLARSLTLFSLSLSLSLFLSLNLFLFLFLFLPSRPSSPSPHPKQQKSSPTSASSPGAAPRREATRSSPRKTSASSRRAWTPHSRRRPRGPPSSRGWRRPCCSLPPVTRMVTATMKKALTGWAKEGTRG